MIKKAFLILCCLYLYVSFVSHEDKTEWFAKGYKVYNTLVQTLKDKNIQIETKDWELGEEQQPVEEVKEPVYKPIKKKRSF